MKKQSHYLNVTLEGQKEFTLLLYRNRLSVHCRPAAPALCWYPRPQNAQFKKAHVIHLCYAHLITILKRSGHFAVGNVVKDGHLLEGGPRAQGPCAVHGAPAAPGSAQLLRRALRALGALSGRPLPILLSPAPACPRHCSVRPSFGADSCHRL